MSGFGYNILGFGGGGPPPPEVDDGFNRVNFLSHFDGANNGVNNEFDDGSASNHSVTRNGDAQQGSFGPFARPDGEWGVDFAGNSGARKGLKLCAGYQAELVMTGTFTIEFWLFHRYLNGTQCFFGSGGGYSGWAGNIGHEIIAFCGEDSNMYCQFWNGSELINTEARAIALNEGEWNHVAVVNNGGDWTYYLNGTGGTTTTFGDVGAITSTGTWASYIGGNHGSGDNNACIGVMSNARFVKGTAVYTSNFTPPTAPLTDITNTSSLVAQNNRFIDNSSHANTLSTTGVGKVSAFGPLLTDAAYDSAVKGASCSFDGTGDFLTVPDSSDFTLGNTFTLEAWIYPTASNNYNSVQNQNGSSGYYWAHISGEKMQFYRGVTSGITHDSAASSMLNQWTHVAYVCDGGTAYHYINGVRSGSSASMSVADISAVITVGIQGNQFAFPGFISDYRMVVGTAVYSGTTYTIPTAPLTAITNTKLLLNMADGQAIDSTAQRNLILEGNAQISTGQAKFGDTSLLLDGTNDLGQLDNINDLAGPFTIETWAWADDTTNAFMWSHGEYTLELGITGNTLRMYRVGTATEYTNFFTGGEFSVDTWHHVALVRDTSNVIKCYLNGTASGTTVTDATAFAATYGSFIIGGEYKSRGQVSHGWDGYIDEFRISDFARYTSDFTVQSEQFADQGQV